MLFSVLKSVFSDNIHLPTHICWYCNSLQVLFHSSSTSVLLGSSCAPSYSINSVHKASPIVLKKLYLVYSSCSWPGSGGKNFTARRSIVVFGPRRKVGHFTIKKNKWCSSQTYGYSVCQQAEKQHKESLARFHIPANHSRLWCRLFMSSEIKQLFSRGTWIPLTRWVCRLNARKWVSCNVKSLIPQSSYLAA